jgi:hypothetical protein
VPLTANALVDYSHKAWAWSAHYVSMTGRPYTPLLQALSAAQDRPIFDLSNINSVRMPNYSRMDVRMQWTKERKRGNFVLFIGLDNVWDHPNIYEMVWTRLCSRESCPLHPVTGMGRYLDGGWIYQF